MSTMMRATPGANPCIWVFAAANALMKLVPLPILDCIHQQDLPRQRHELNFHLWAEFLALGTMRTMEGEVNAPVQSADQCHVAGGEGGGGDMGG